MLYSWDNGNQWLETSVDSKSLGLTVMMFVVTMAGCLEILPFYIYETVTYMPMPYDFLKVFWIAVLAIVTSLIPVYL